MKHEQTISSTEYSMLMGTSYKSGNFPKEYVNEAISQLQRLSISQAQYKEDAQEQAYINNLMAADLEEMKEHFTRYAQISKCTTTQLICSVVIIKINKILNNQSFDLTELLKA